jgi:hypothetical protein
VADDVSLLLREPVDTGCKLLPSNIVGLPADKMRSDGGEKVVNAGTLVLLVDEPV